MKKRLTALFLCLVMMLSVFLASCADQSLEDAENNLPKEIENPIVARIGVCENFEIRNVLICSHKLHNKIKRTF